MGVVLTQSSTGIGGGGAVAASMEDAFNRTSADLDGDTPDVANTPGNTWTTLNGGGTPTTGLFDCVTTSGGQARIRSTSTTCIATYDMGTTAYADIDATLHCPTASGARNVAVCVRWVDGGNYWVVEGVSTSNIIRIIYRKSNSSVVKASTGFNLSNQTCNVVDTYINGTTVTSTWDTGGSPTTVSYTISGEDVFAASTECGFFLRDSVSINAMYCSNFKAVEI